ncbi:methyltransferase domain-containing protein [Paraferrimonas haliotis]|uniref:Malonyl-[acyl-carrier protein] O-methyltransferase n=1 Tax=Paraferrimonas haliotis TaxID=2013866 RepID=A0AA37WY38_9GAMM|nr:methyltransferase domain-containing protein [Paraferrimonas haliotis]GLS82671.1 malonyl-[acyl-carrier protein] O-methyltransferase [Paraferrimonas haliotis]
MDKVAVAQSFDDAASNYQNHCQLQQQVGSKLVADIEANGIILDLGCGPGSVVRDALIARGAHWFGVDLSLSMLQQARGHQQANPVVQGDVEALPFASQSFDGIVSNMVLQWCDLNRAVEELLRVLKPKGRFDLAIVIKGSLQQLCSNDSGLLRVNDFPSQSLVEQALSQHVIEYQLAVHTETYCYPNARALFSSLKGVGANCSDKPVTGLKGKGWWQQVNAMLEAHRLDEGLPLSYQILYVRGRKL